MPAHYRLSKNHLKPGEEKYRALVKHVETLTQEDILNEMEWHHSSLTKADGVSFLEDYKRTIIRTLRQGKQVTTDLVHYKLSIRGNFNDSEDQFDPSRHRIVPTVSPGPVLQREPLNGVQIEKQRFVKPRPRLDIYINMHNDEPDMMLWPTHTARILGEHLRFDPADPEQGLFLVPQANAADPLADLSAIRVKEISRMTSGEIIFRVPDHLAANEYKIEVRARFGQSGIRTGAFAEVLTVA